MRFFLIATILGLLAYGCRPGDGKSGVADNEDSLGLKKNAPEFLAGKQIYLDNCVQCHVSPEGHETDQFIFQAVFNRVPQPEAYLVRFSSDSRSLKLSGNRYAREADKLTTSNYEHLFRDSISAMQFGYLITYIKTAIKL